LRGITSLPQNKEGMLKIIINKYATKLELNFCKKSFFFWSSDGLNPSIVASTMQSCFSGSYSNKDSQVPQLYSVTQETNVMPIGVSLRL
jgi:hypothetical protein